MKAPVPAGEAERLDALRRYAILDTPPEQDFDELVSLASQICRTPIAAISLIDEDRQWFKAKVGLTATQTPRAIAFCAHAIVQTDLFVVQDAMADPRFSGNPLVTADPHIRFYAGMPLIASDGHALGTLCVIDRVPRELTQEQAEALRVLSHEVVAQLELRRTQRDLVQSAKVQRELAERSQAESTLRMVVEGVESQIGERFFPSLVKQLATVLGVQYAYVSELSEDRTCFRSRAGWGRGSFLPSFEVPERGPCETVLKRRVVHHPDQLQELYPHVQVIADWRAVSYCGVPIVDLSGDVLGHLAILDDKPMPDEMRATSILGIFAGRARAELERLRAEAGVRKGDATLRAIVEGVEAETGNRFFPSLVRHLAVALGVQYGFVTEFSEDRTRFRTLAVWGRGALMDNFEIPLAGTPCEAVLNGQIAHHPERVQALFPEDRGLVEWHAESYCGVPLVDSSGTVVGHLAIIDNKPMPEGARATSIMRIFAVRAVAEIERLHAEQALAESEERFRSVVESATDAIILADHNGLILSWNKAAVRLFGYTQEEVAGRPLTLLMPACYRANHERGLERLRATGESRVIGKTLELHGMRKDGNEFPLELSLATWKTKEGTFFSGVIRDITERKRAAASLQESEQRLRDLFDEAPIAYVHEGLDTRFLRANRAAIRSLGIKPEEIAGTYGKSFIPDTPEAQHRLREALASIGRGTDTSGVVLELRRKDNGKPLWIQWWSRPDPSGAYTRTMFLDITDRVLMEQEKARLEAQKTYLQEEIQTEHNFEEVIGTAPAIKKVLRAVEQVAATDATVLITGETGTGKELIARALHNLSPRKQGVLVKVNCAAIPAGLIESELFGHEKGAFTGALARKIGRFELADRATIFLDEVGEIPLELQTKLLRVLQEGEFERLGSGKTIKVNVRVVAATNRDPEREVREGRLRSDLYYRLNGFPIHLPALRDRKQDIPLLVAYFVKKYATDLSKKIETIAQPAMEALKAYAWPGNIRELEHVIERAVILSQGPQLELGDWLPRPSVTSGDSAPTTLEEMERAHILETLERTGWLVSGEKGAAKLLDLKPTTLEARMKKLGITRKR